MQKFNVNDFHIATLVILNEFGSDWLSKESAKSPDKKHSPHPIASAWLETVTNLETYKRTNKFFITEQMHWFVSFAFDLDKAQKLSNYQLAISSRLKNKIEFPKAAYEMFVASWWTQAGYSVEFIPTKQNQRTPEMKVRVHQEEIFIECKNKDTYVIQAKSDKDGVFWKNLYSDLTQILEKIETENGLEVLIFIPDAGTLADIPKIIDEIKYKLDLNFRGRWTGRQAGYLIQEVETNHIIRNERELFLPDSYNPGFVVGRVKENDQGELYFGDTRRVACFAIKSHSLSSLSKSFKDAQGQIPPNQIGLIYVNVDVSNLQVDEAKVYIETVAESLATRFSPGQNTRIAGVVITTDPYSLSKNQNTNKQILTRFAKIIRNPYSTLPNNLSIPGEA